MQTPREFPRQTNNKCYKMVIFLHISTYMKTTDFYTGFEGEPEFILTRRNVDGQTVELLRLWDGYFVDVINQIPVGSNGRWEGIPLQHHLVIGWNNNVPWQDPNPELFLSQLDKIDPSKFELDSSAAFRAIKEIVSNCLMEKQNLVIERD